MERLGIVKPGIHPTYYEDALVVCACGNTWHTGSTKKEIHTDVCFKCHPFYTGEQRIVDTAGQVERFMKRVTAREQMATPETQAKPSKKERRAKARQARSGMPEAEEETGAPEATPTAVTAEGQAPEGAADQPRAGQSRAERRRNRPPRQPRAEGTAEPQAEKPAEPPAEGGEPAPATGAE
jgi:large subunit ribosomal protein L31